MKTGFLSVAVCVLMICRAPAQQLVSYSTTAAGPTGLYGIKDAYGKWLLSPRFQEIADFYDDRFTSVKDVAVFQRSKKKVNGTDEQLSGLLNDKGKILIPALYNSLTCENGLCLTREKNYGKRKIIDFSNRLIEEIPFTFVTLKDSMVIYEDGHDRYFKKAGTAKTYGPYKQAAFDKANRLIYVEEAGTKKLLTYNGRTFLEDPGLINRYTGEFLFGDELYVRQFPTPDSGLRSTFANMENSSTYGQYQQINPGKDRTYLKGCIEVGHSRGFEECTGPSFTVLQLLSILKKRKILERDHKTYFENADHTVALISAEGKILSKPYSCRNSDFSYGPDLYTTENNIPEYVQLDDNGREIFRNPLPAVYYSRDFQLLYDHEKKEYFVNYPDRQVKIRPDNKKRISVTHETYHSDVLLLDNEGDFFFINKKGKIYKNTNQNCTNFYGNRAFYREKDRYYIVDEKFRKKSALDPAVGYIPSIDRNGNAVFNNKDHQGIVQVMTGRILTQKPYDRIWPDGTNRYLAERKQETDGYGKQPVYDLISPDGQMILEGIRHTGNVGGRYFYYSIRKEDSEQDDEYFYDPRGGGYREKCAAPSVGLTSQALHETG